MVVANVILWDQLVGAVLWDDRTGVAAFEMDSAISKHGWDIAPLTMPINQAGRGIVFQFPNLPRETYQGLPGLLSDALPDRFGNQLIDIWLASQGRSRNSMNPVERLCYIGNRGMGALEFEPAVRNETEKSIPLEIHTLVELSKKALDQKASLQTQFSKEDAKALSDIIRVGTSAGGARAKAVIAYNEKTGEVRSGQLKAPAGFEHWLIKFDGVTNIELGDPKGYGRIEYAYYRMAIDCGIIMMPSKLLQEGNRAHFMTKRFDRIDHNEKVHAQTVCGLCHYDYNNPYVYSYEQVFQVMRQLRLPYTDAEQLYTRMVFNVVSRNQDDHTKNISFLMDKSGKWSLSQAYDVTYAFNPENKWTSQHQLSINGKREGIVMFDLLEVAKQMNIKKAKEIIEEIRIVVSQWNQYANAAGLSTTQIASITKTHLLAL